MEKRSPSADNTYELTKHSVDASQEASLGNSVPPRGKIPQNNHVVCPGFPSNLVVVRAG